MPRHRSSDEDREKIETAVDGLVATLEGAGVRAKSDKRSGYSPGWKFNQAEVGYAMASVSSRPTNVFASLVVSPCDSRLGLESWLETLFPPLAVIS